MFNNVRVRLVVSMLARIWQSVPKHDRCGHRSQTCANGGVVISNRICCKNHDLKLKKSSSTTKKALRVSEVLFLNERETRLPARRSA